MSAFSLSCRELGEGEPRAEKKTPVCRTRWPSGHGMHDALEKTRDLDSGEFTGGDLTFFFHYNLIKLYEKRNNPLPCPLLSPVG